MLTLDALDMSGVAFSAQNLVTGLRRNGVQVMVLSRLDGERKMTFRELGAEVVVLKHFGVPFFGRSAAAAVKAFQPKIIHAQSMQIAARSFKLARATGLPLAITSNRFDDCDNPFASAHKGTPIIAVSDAIQERLGNRAGISREKVKVIPNGLDLKHFPQPDFDTRSRLHHVPVIGTYGTLAEEKGQRVFVQAAGILLREKIDAEFLIMGHGPDKPELRRLAEEQKITSRVTFSPSTTTDTRNLANIDIFVEPTFKEGLGLSVMQAMAAGVPVVASGVGGIYSLIEDGETGVLVNSGDADGLARAIKDLLADENLRSDLARRAREKIEKRFSAENVAREILEFYAGVIEATGAPQHA